jgi:mono/diheme cytochrome c family protein
MFELLYPATSLFTTALFFWSGFRAWRAQNRFLKWGGAGLSVLLSTLTASISVVLIVGLIKVHARSAPTVVMKVEGTPEQIRRGQAIADSFCGACHTKTAKLTGGVDIGEHFPINVGSLVSANLTPAGELSHWSDGDIFRAIRNAVDPDGRWLFVMSLTNVSRLSDDDTRSVIAYLRSLPAAGEPTPNPSDRISGLGLLMMGVGLLPTGKPVSTVVISAPPPEPTARYGEYIMSYQDCRECHGKDLSGGVPGQLPPLGPDLHMVKNWKFEQFLTTLRTGVDPYGHELGKQMPWRPLGKMSDDELRALYEYLVQLPNT